MRTNNVSAAAILLGLAATNFSAAAADCVPPPSGLVAWWPGDGDALDAVGTNHGTLVSAATFAAGQVGQAFSFDGVDDSVTAGTDEAFNFTGGTADFTIQAWIYPWQMAGLTRITIPCVLSPRPWHLVRTPDGYLYSMGTVDSDLAAMAYGKSPHGGTGRR
jgi:hypothetical protein